MYTKIDIKYLPPNTFFCRLHEPLQAFATISTSLGWTHCYLKMKITMKLIRIKIQKKGLKQRRRWRIVR